MVALVEVEPAAIALHEGDGARVGVGAARPAREQPQARTQHTREHAFMVCSVRAAVRRPPHDGHRPRALHERGSCPQAAQP